MRDYFEYLKVDKGDMGDNEVDALKIKACNTMILVTPSILRQGAKGDNISSSPTVTPTKINEVTCETSENKDVPLSPLVTFDFTHLYELYEERAAIIEFEAGMSREEAERLAYREVLIEFMFNQYPETKDELEAII